MTAQTAVQKLIDTFAEWPKYIRELKEMYEMNRVLRDMERVCALCPHKRRCIEDLAAGAYRKSAAQTSPRSSGCSQ